jgi:hypothetical protein
MTTQFFGALLRVVRLADRLGRRYNGEEKDPAKARGKREDVRFRKRPLQGPGQIQQGASKTKVMT